MSDTNTKYFQYHRDVEFPVFLKVEEVDAFSYADSFYSCLNQLNFVEIKDSEIDRAMADLSQNPTGRLLTIKPANHKVARQIVSASHSDRFGHESIFLKDNYKVYRFKNQALLVYAYAADAWECGVMDSFGDGDEGIFAMRSVLARFLSWALAPLGVVGFWGVPVKEGLVILKQRESQGEAVFLDFKNEKIFSMDGSKKIPAFFKILRLDSTLKNRNIIMSSEELLSFLSVHTTFMDPEGHSTPIRQLLQAVAKRGEGVIYPRDKFQPREESSRE